MKWQERRRLIEYWSLDRNRDTKKAKTQLIIEPTSDATDYEAKPSWQSEPSGSAEKCIISIANLYRMSGILQGYPVLDF